MVQHFRDMDHSLSLLLAMQSTGQVHQAASFGNN
jgi:hypothetical protein